VIQGRYVDLADADIVVLDLFTYAGTMSNLAPVAGSPRLRVERGDIRAAARASSDLLVRAYHRTHGLPVCVTRCSNNYGPHQFPEKVIPLFISHLLDGKKVPLYGDGLNVRDWLHVDDHCRGIQLVAEKGRPGEVYNIGGGAELTNKELTYRRLGAVGANESMIQPVTDRKGHDRRYSVNWSKIADELGYRPQVSFDEGLAATVKGKHSPAVVLLRSVTILWGGSGLLRHAGTSWVRA